MCVGGSRSPPKDRGGGGGGGGVETPIPDARRIGIYQSAKATVAQGNQRPTGRLGIHHHLLEKTMKRLSVYILTSIGLLAAAGIATLPALADSTQTEDELRTSKIVGSKVYNNANENIGSVEDIVLKPDGSMDEVVLSVGGFLGIGDKYVSVPFNDLKITRDGSSLKITTDGTKDP